MNKPGQGHIYFTICDYEKNPKMCDPCLPAINIILGIILFTERSQATWEKRLIEFRLCLKRKRSFVFYHHDHVLLQYFKTMQTT